MLLSSNIFDNCLSTSPDAALLASIHDLLLESCPSRVFISPNPQITKKNEFTKNLDNLLKILIKILFDLSYGTDISNSIKRLKTFRDCIKSIKQDTPNEVIC